MNEMLYKFKVITKNSNETIFEVDFNDLENYKVITDLSDNFEKKFLKIMKGEYSHNYFDKKSQTIKSINIDTKDAIKNLKKYINVCTASFHSIANLTNIKGE